jgi:AbrB family looped-hinge helix DNA binding protein
MSKITAKYQLTLPKAVAEKAGYKPGDEVECEAAGQAIRVQHKAAKREPHSTTERLILFDLATERQAHRQRSLPSKAPKSKGSHRGWAREELYER